MHTHTHVTPMTAAPSADVHQSVVGFFMGIVGEPALLIGLFALLGCIIQRKRVVDAISSTFKVIVGFLVLMAGAAALVTALGGVTKVLNNVFAGGGTTVLLPSFEIMLGWISEHLSHIMQGALLIMLLGMVLNLVLAKLSRLKYIYLSGNVLLFISMAMAAALDVAGIHVMGGIGDSAIVIIGSAMMLATYMVIAPAINQRFATAVIGNDRIGISNTSSINLAMAGWIGVGIGKWTLKRNKKIVSTEKIKIPKKLSFMKEEIISSTLVLGIIFIIVVAVGLSLKGLAAFNDVNGSILGKTAENGLNWGNAIVFPFLHAFLFMAGLTIARTGTKMFITELVETFEGISTKFIRGAIPAVSMIVFWDEHPQALIIGLISSLIGGLITVGAIIGIHFALPQADQASVPIVLPQLLSHLYIGGTAAIWANAKGGWKGAVVASFISGIIVSLLPLLFFSTHVVTQGVMDNTSSIWPDPDLVIAPISKGFAQVSKWLFLGVSFIVYMLPMAYNGVKTIIERKNGTLPKSNKKDKVAKVKS